VRSDTPSERAGHVWSSPWSTLWPDEDCNAESRRSASAEEKPLQSPSSGPVL